MSTPDGAPQVRRYEPEGGILSNAVTAGGFLTCVSMADDLGLDIVGQIEQALAYVDHCLGLAGVGRDSLVQMTILLSDIRHRAVLNDVWTGWLGDAGRPARACVEARLADPRFLIEIIAVAALPPGAQT